MKDLDQQSKTIYLKEYKKPDFLIDNVELTFELYDEKTRVVSVLQVIKNTSDKAASLVLMGEGLELGEVKIDNILLDSSAYKVTDTTLTIADVADKFSLEIETFTKPQENFSLEGLYKSVVITARNVRQKGLGKSLIFWTDLM
jgi:aminopeptidase N